MREEALALQFLVMCNVCWTIAEVSHRLRTACKMMPQVKTFLVQLALLHWQLMAAQELEEGQCVSYTRINGSLCINIEFVETHRGISSDLDCSLRCHRNQRCQAFTTADGACQLFVFDKCSKSVRNCSCSRRGKVFVKQQPGLEPGALCPSGYVDDLCGVKYKMYVNSWNWTQSRQKCESDSQLAIMADVTDVNEMEHIDALYIKYDMYFFLGGYQPDGSPEPGGGFYWVGCNITFNSSFWAADSPTDGAGWENTLGRYNNPGIDDFYEMDSGIPGALCECLSPFD